MLTTFFAVLILQNKKLGENITSTIYTYCIVYMYCKSDLFMIISGETTGPEGHSWPAHLHNILQNEG